MPGYAGLFVFWMNIKQIACYTIDIM